jgi:hypothetical protein
MDVKQTARDGCNIIDMRPRIGETGEIKMLLLRVQDLLA